MGADNTVASDVDPGGTTLTLTKVGNMYKL